MLSVGGAPGNAHEAKILPREKHSSKKKTRGLKRGEPRAETKKKRRPRRVPTKLTKNKAPTKTVVVWGKAEETLKLKRSIKQANYSEG